MKSNYLITLFSIIICLLNLTTICQSQILVDNQLNQARQLIEDITIDSADDVNPCIQYAIYFNCQPINDGTNSGLYTVVGIQLENAQLMVPQTTADFSLFKNLTYIVLSPSVETTQNIINILPELLYITEVTIGNQILEVDSSLVMPPKLGFIQFNRISVPLASWMFTTGVLENLIIDSVFPGFKYPIQFASSNALRYLTTVQTHFSGVLPANTGQAFKNLKNLDLKVNNDLDIQGYTSQSFPTFSSYIDIESIQITFINEGNYQKFNFDQSITTIPNLVRVEITGPGLVNPTNSTLIDFSKLQPNFGLYLRSQATAFIGDCKISSCLLLPKQSSLTIGECSLNLSKINYSNITHLSVDNNQLEQTLPVSNINYPRVIQFKIVASNIVGTIPEEYCQFPINVLSLGENELSGDVPTCFLCYNAGAFPNIFPNQFANWNSTANWNSCPTFTIGSYNKIVKTDGTTTLTITGKDFGFVQPDGSQPPRLQSNANVLVENPILTITVSNTEMELWFPAGVVGSGKNLTFTKGFGLESMLEYTFSYSYEIPVIHGYNFVIINEETVFVLNGTGFNYVLQNNFIINGQTYLGEPNSPSEGGSKMIGENDPSTAITVGNSFTVSVEVGGQVSETRTFYLYKDLSLVQPTTKLLSYGGSLVLSGQFSTSTKDNVHVFINGIPCTVNSVSSMSISIVYPQSIKGIYQLRVSVGGFNLYSSVEYIAAQKPSESSSSSTEQDVSFSSKLSISITLFLLLSILSTLLI